MPQASYANIVQPIATKSLTVCFDNLLDNQGIAIKFGDKFADLFSKAVQSYVGMCTGLPIGGPVTRATTVQLEQDLYEAGKQAFTETFIGYDDMNKLADKFGTQLKPIAASIASWIATCQTVLATPPTVSVSPGGPLIVTPSLTVMPAMLQCSRLAIQATFQGQQDPNNIAELFATQFSLIAPTISTYVQEAVSLPGGGLLQLA